MNYGYVYQRSGGPLLSWKNGPPRQTRAADAVSLGDLVLPRAGAPEPINGLGAYENNGGYLQTGPGMGCACAGPSMGGIVDSISGLSTPVKIAGAVGLFLLYKKLKKKR